MPIFNPIKRAVVFILSTLFMISCGIDADISDRGIGSPHFPDPFSKVTTSVISGFVTDENDNPASGAVVEAGGQLMQTDRNGYFEIKNAVVLKEAATVTTSFPLYFTNVKTFIGEEGKGAFFRIKLIHKSNDGTIDAATGGTVSLSNGVKIDIPANAVVDAVSNIPYIGTINVSVKLLSATDPDLNRMMPGDLRGISSENTIKILTTYGMIGVELTGTNNKLLQIAAGKKAGLTFPIPASLQASAPATIPLWYFDNTTGLWKEEAAATKTGNNYIAAVSHFSFWNCDVPNNYVQFSCTIAGPNGLPISGAFVKISFVNNPQLYATGYTDQSGYVAGAIPPNANLKLQVFPSSNCNTPSYEQVFTTSSGNISLGTVVITTPNAVATITGTATDCNNAPLSSAHILILSNQGNFYYPLSNGNYSFNYLLCGNSSATVNIIVYSDSVLQTLPQPISVNPGINTIPNIQACNLLSNFVHLTIFGTTYDYTTPPNTIVMLPSGSNAITINFYDIPPQLVNAIIFQSNGISTGSAQPLVFLVWHGSPLVIAGGQPVVNITSYGAIGQPMTGNFNFSPNAISGNFRVTRTF